MRNISRSFIAVLLFLCSSQVWAQANADDILGVWRTTSPFNDDTAHVRITRGSDGLYSGIVVWTNHPTNDDGSVRCDVKNKNPKLRTRKWNEVILCWNLQFKNGEWVKGNLYDPYSGKTFGVKLKPDKTASDIEARYYMGTPSIGITMKWKLIK